MAHRRINVIRRVTAAAIVAGALLAGPLALAWPTGAQAAAPPPERPPWLCSASVTIGVGDDGASWGHFDVRLLLRPGSSVREVLLKEGPWTTPTSEGSPLYGTIANNRTRRFWVRPVEEDRGSLCVNPDHVQAVELRFVQSEPLFLSGTDDVDLTRLTIADSVSGYRYWDQDGLGRRLVRFTATDDTYRSNHPFGGRWFPPLFREPLTADPRPPTRPRFGICLVDVTVGAGSDDLDSAASYKVQLQVRNQRRPWTDSWDLIDDDGNRWITGGIPSNQVVTHRMTLRNPHGAAGCPRVEDLMRVTVWRSDGDPFKFADKWDLNRLKITDAANGYRYWDLGAIDHTLTRLDEHAIGWESLDPFDDSQAGIHTRGRRIE